MLYCVLKLCVTSLRRAVLTFLWIGSVTLGSFHCAACVDSFVFMCLYFVCFFLILHICHITVTWWGGPGEIEA